MICEVMSKTGTKYYLNLNQIAWFKVEGPYEVRIAMTDGLEILVGYDVKDILHYWFGVKEDEVQS